MLFIATAVELSLCMVDQNLFRGVAILHLFLSGWTSFWFIEAITVMG